MYCIIPHKVMKVQNLHSQGRRITIKGTLFLACLRVLCREEKGKREGGREKERKERKRCS